MRLREVSDGHSLTTSLFLFHLYSSHMKTSGWLRHAGSLADPELFIYNEYILQYLMIPSSRAEARDPFSQGAAREKHTPCPHSAQRRRQRADRRMDHGLRRDDGIPLL
jgi:hypothetical protein